MCKSFILFQEYEKNIALLSQSQKGDLLDAIFSYNNGQEIELDPIVKMAFSFIKLDLDRNKESYQKKQEERSTSGRIGNLKRHYADIYKRFNAGEINLEEAEREVKSRKTSLSDNSDRKTRLNDNVNDNVNVNVISKDIIKEKKFKRPTLEQVQEYCQERKNSVDPQKWFDHYASNGWKVGRNSMKDWRAAVRKWESSDFNKSSNDMRVEYMDLGKFDEQFKSL